MSFPLYKLGFTVTDCSATLRVLFKIWHVYVYGGIWAIHIKHVKCHIHSGKFQEWRW